MSDRVSPEDLMRYLDGEASEEERERVGRRLATCKRVQEEMILFGTFRSELRSLFPALARSQGSIWELVRNRLEIGG